MLQALLILLGFLAAAYYQLLPRRSQPLHKGWVALPADSTVTLASADTLQIAAVFLSILLKYIPGMRGNKIRLVPDAGKEGFDLQPLSFKGPIVITSKDVDTFTAAVARQPGSHSTQQLNPFFLVSFTTPLLLYTLSSHDCPIRPLGSVNTRNRFEFEDASFCQSKGAILEASQAATLSYTCTFGGQELPGKRRKRGVEFDIVIEVKSDDRVVLRQHLSFLQFLPSKQAPRFNEQAHADSRGTAGGNESEEVISQYDLQISTFDPLRCAASCRDYNPIHVSTLAAKAFGFRSTIAHGNHAVALSIQALVSGPEQDQQGGKEKESVQGCFSKSRFGLEVAFVKPMFLPAKLSVCWQGTGEQRQLRIKAKDTLVVSGQLTS